MSSSSAERASRLPGQAAGRQEWQPATRRERTLLALYFLVFVVVTDLFNVRLGVELLTLMVLIAAFTITRAGAQFLRDWWYFLGGLILWNLSGPIAAGSPFPVHLEELIRADRLLLLNHGDPVVILQHAFSSASGPRLLDWVSGIGYNLHLPEPYIAGYFLWRLNPAGYRQFVAAVLILLVLGFITFILFPAMPPWMASTWYRRLPNIHNGFGQVLHAHPFPLRGSPVFGYFHLHGDAVASVPSEHAAFPLLECLAFSLIAPRAARLLLLWCAFVLFTVVYLGMHWVVDPLIGWVYAVAIFWFVHWFACARPTR